MRILELSLRNYRVFEEVDLELPARVIGIFGENGSGKSTLMESVAFALYGVEAVRTKKQQIRTHGVLTDCVVRLVFEHAGQQYEVRRTIRGKGHTPEAELFGGGLQLASGTTEVDAETRRLLHMDRHVFKASVFAEQKQLDAFSEVTQAKRKEMALRLLGIKPVDDARTSARREARATKEMSVQLAGAVPDLSVLQAELKDAKDAAAEAGNGAKAAARELKTATAAAKAAKRSFEEVDASRQRVEKLTVQLREKTEQRTAVAERRDQLAERIEGLETELASLPDLERELAALDGVGELMKQAERLAERSSELEGVETELDALPEVDAAGAAAALESARAELAAAQREATAAATRHEHEANLLEEAEARLDRAAEADPSQPCPTCGQPLGDGFAAYRKHCRDEVAAAKKRVRDSERAARDAASAASKAELTVASATEAGEEAAAADSARRRLAERTEKLKVEVAELTEPFEGRAPDLEVLRGQHVRATELGKEIAGLESQRKHLDRAREDLASAENHVSELGTELGRLAEEAAGLAFDPQAHSRLAEELREAEAALEATRDAEREAGDASKDADKRVGELSATLAQARETAAKVDELRSDARYADRVAMLLDGFRDHLVSRVGPELSREAEALFRDLTNHEYDDLKIDEETLSIQIADGDSYFAIDRFSGSETDLANLALRVAISVHLSRVSGTDVGMMVLDEVLASLDEERKDLMVQTLGKLSSRFHQLFVITHAERVKDQFPASIIVQKSGRRRSTAVLV